jgi:V/A-type H+-transporting ATPase subunit F
MRSYKIAMIGDDSTVSGFAAAGVVGYPVAESSEALRTLDGLARSGEYAIVFISEDLAGPILPEISRISAGKSGIGAQGAGSALPGDVPSIVVIPDQSGSRGIGFEKIRSAVEKALGIDILGKEAGRDN